MRAFGNAADMARLSMMHYFGHYVVQTWILLGNSFNADRHCWSIINDALHQTIATI